MSALQALVDDATAVVDSWEHPWLPEAVNVLDGTTSTDPPDDDRDHQELHDAAREVVEHWATGMLAEMVQTLDETIDAVVARRPDLARPTPDAGEI